MISPEAKSIRLRSQMIGRAPARHATFVCFFMLSKLPRSLGGRRPLRRSPADLSAEAQRVEVEAQRAKVETRVTEMADKLLANPVIESYRVEVLP